MANVFHNKVSTTKFFSGSKINKREKAVSQSIATVAVTDSAYSIASDDGIDCFRNAGAVTITLPPAAENKGRCITFLQTDVNTLTIAQNADSANIDGADSDFTSLDAADDWAELYCTGSEWIILKQNIS